MTSERKKRRWWIWTLGGIVGLLLLIVAAGVFVLDRYATQIVIQALLDANLPEPRLQVDSVGLSESRLSAIRLGADDALVADGVIVEYDVLDLIDLEPSDLTIRLVRPTLKLSIDEDGRVSLGSLDAIRDGATGEGGALPFREVVLSRATVQIETPLGRIDARADGSIENRGADGLAIAATVLSRNDLLAFDGDVAVTIDAAGAVAGEATVRGISGTTPWGAVEGGQGTLALRWSGDGVPHGDIDMTFAGLLVRPDMLPERLSGGADGLRLDEIAVRAGFDGAALSAAVSASDSGGGNAVSLDIRIPDVVAGGQATIVADLSTSGGQVLWLWQDEWTGEGTLTAAVEATTHLPPLAALLGGAATLSAIPDGQATVRWILSDARFGGIARQVSAVGDVRIAVTDGIATLTAEAPVELRIGALDPSVPAFLAEADPAWRPIVERDLIGHIDLALEGRGSRPLNVTFSRRGEGWTIRGDATVLAATAEGPLVAAEVTGNATMDETFAVVIDDMSLFASEIETPAGAVGVLELAGRFAWRDGVPDFDIAGAASSLEFNDPQLSFPRIAIELAMAPSPDDPSGAIAGPIALSFADAGGAIEEVAMTGLSGELVGRLVWDDGIGQLFFSENAAFRVESMDIDGDVLIPEPALVRVTASEHPALELDLNDPASWSLRHSLNIGPLDIQGSIRVGEERIQTAVRTTGLVMEGGYLEGAYAMQIDITGVSGSAPERGWSIDGATVAISYDDNDDTNMLVLEATATDLNASETQGALSRIGLRGRMDYGLDDVIRITARVFDERNILIADVNARHDIDTNGGSAEVAVQDLIFNPLVLQPGDISPLLTGFENVTGTADVSGAVSWNGSAITPDLALLISNVSGVYDDVAFTGINTVIELANLSPLETGPGQLLSIAAVDLGVPISNAEVLFALDDGETLAVQQANFDFAGGAVTAENQSISFTADEQVIDLVVTGVDLDTLLALADLETLESQGTLDGVIPIIIINGDLVIPEAWLSAREPGFIRYDAGADLGSLEGANQGIDLMIELLENFLYDELDLRLMRPVAGDLQVGFRILGRNPDVYGGVPIDLSLNVDGELEDIIRNSLELYRVPETIQDLIMEHGFDVATPTN